MPRRTRTPRRGDLSDPQLWERLLGPRSCSGTSCARPGHRDRVFDPAGPDTTQILDHHGGQVIGLLPCCSNWATEAEREAAYWLARDELTTNPGTRCWGFWRYEARLDARPTDEAAWLAAHEALTPRRRPRS